MIQKNAQYSAPTAFEYNMYEYMYVTLLCKVIILYQLI